MKNVKKFLSGKFALVIVAILALVIGGSAGFFAGQKQEKSSMEAQRTKMMKNFQNGGVGGQHGFPGGTAPSGAPSTNENSGTTGSSSSDSTTSGA